MIKKKLNRKTPKLVGVIKRPKKLKIEPRKPCLPPTLPQGSTDRYMDDAKKFISQYPDCDDEIDEALAKIFLKDQNHQESESKSWYELDQEFIRNDILENDFNDQNVSNNPYYDDNLDMDQQSDEFWNCY